MKLNDFIAGLLILKTYYNDPDGYHIGAGHDEFYMYSTDRPLSPEDVKKMRILGWFQPNQETNAAYAPDKAWAAYV